jgi:adenylosuccinate lyase
MYSLLAISPIDGRYKRQIEVFENYFSEYALMRYRVWVEVEYFIFLSGLKLFPLTAGQKKQMLQWAAAFSVEQSQQIKNIEKTTNHDVKAVEYFVKQYLQENKLEALTEWVHFGLTSQDINNTAIPLSLKEAMEQVYWPSVINIISLLHQQAQTWKNIAMLARTHGQPASPTALGKEIMVFVSRLQQQLQQALHIPYTAKFGGATGNFNAHYIAFPHINWTKKADQFISNKLGLERQTYTTQIEPYDNLASICHAIVRVNNILIDFCRDIWTYIMLEYFGQKTKAGEIGSSAMPHKVNPIDFENAEGNLGISNALLEHFAAKLPISRLQRDLTDSTVLRNIGVPIAHSFIALNSLEKGINKLIVNKQKISDDLENHPEVIAEAIQTILRAAAVPNAYELLKDLTRGKQKITKKQMENFVKKLNVGQSIKNKLLKLSPQTYTGNATQSF